MIVESLRILSKGLMGLIEIIGTKRHSRDQSSRTQCVTIYWENTEKNQKRPKILRLERFQYFRYVGFHFMKKIKKNHSPKHRVK